MCADAAATFKLDAYVEPKLNDSLRGLRDNIDQPAALVLYNCSKRGLRVDQDVMNQMEEFLEKNLKLQEAAMSAVIGAVKVPCTTKGITRIEEKKFNPRSNPHVGAFLFDMRGYKSKVKTESGGRAVGVEDVLVPLHKVNPDDEVLSALIAYKTTYKNLNTFIRGKKAGLKTQMKEGRLHTGFSVSRLHTGRTSSFHPNLQNLPEAIQAVIIPDPGYKFVYADYSQLELRCLAFFSKDAELMEALDTGDVHRATAARSNGILFDEVTPIQRSRAKTVNFGIVYGESAYALAQKLGITEEEAALLQKEAFPYAKAQAWIAGAIQRVKYPPHEIVGLFGRTRRLSHAGRGGRYAERAARQGVNAPIQSMGGDLLKVAMIKVDKELVKRGYDKRTFGTLDDIAWIILEIHDMLMVQSKDEYIDEMVNLMQDQMTMEIQGVNFPVDIEIKDRLQKLDLDLLITDKRLRAAA